MWHSRNSKYPPLYPLIPLCNPLYNQVDDYDILYWLAVKEPHLSYYIGETILTTIYIYILYVCPKP